MELLYWLCPSYGYKYAAMGDTTCMGNIRVCAAMTTPFSTPFFMASGQFLFSICLDLVASGHSVDPSSMPPFTMIFVFLIHSLSPCLVLMATHPSENENLSAISPPPPPPRNCFCLGGGINISLYIPGYELMLALVIHKPNKKTGICWWIVFIECVMYVNRLGGIAVSKPHFHFYFHSVESQKSLNVVDCSYM